MSRFTLHPCRWYACQFIGDGYDSDEMSSYSFSAIKIHDVIPSNTGNRQFKLKFYHANYPEGMRDKLYNLQTLDRGKTYTVAQSIDHDPVRILRIYEVTHQWLSMYLGVETNEVVDVQDCIEQRA